MRRWGRIDAQIGDHLLIIGAGLVIFSVCLFDFFVSDDFLWLSRGVNLSLHNLLDTTPGTTQNIFRPLIPVTFFVFHKLFGLSPFGYHASGILLHIVNGLLLYRVLLHFSLEREIALVSALIFISHFAHEETLFWISGVCVLGCWFFCLSSILAFLKWLQNGKKRLYALSLTCASVAFFFREDALVLLPVLAAIAFRTHLRSKRSASPPLRGRAKWTVLTGLLPFVGMSSVYFYLRTVSLPYMGFGEFFSLSPANLIRNFVYFLVNLILPVRFVFDAIGYRYSQIINSAVNSVDSNALIVVACLLAICAAAVAFLGWLNKKDTSIRLLVVIFLLALFPPLFFKGYGLRFIYLPLLGFSPLAAHLLLSLVKKATNRNFWLRRRCVWLSLIVILSLNFFILLERHVWWRKASILCEETVTNAGTVMSSLPSGSRICFVDLPKRLHGAYIFKNGFAEAMTLFYPSRGDEIRTIDSEDLAGLKPAELANWHWYRYEEREFHRVFQPIQGER